MLREERSGKQALKKSWGHGVVGRYVSRGAMMLNLCAPTPCPSFQTALDYYLWSEGDHSVEGFIGAGNRCSSLDRQRSAYCQPGRTPYWSG